jgi:hypothetical protein
MRQIDPEGKITETLVRRLKSERALGPWRVAKMNPVQKSKSKI